MTSTTTVWFPAATRPGVAPARLRGRLRLPPPDIPSMGVAVLSHPHPGYGGHMDVWLLPSIAAALAAAGWTILRFDFRGVGLPLAGAGDGLQETTDLAGAIDFVLADGRGPAPRCALVGWSFGALVGMLHGPSDPRVTDWVGIGPPTRNPPGLPLQPAPLAAMRGWGARKTVIVGAHDQYFPAADAALLGADAVHVVAGADHFLFDRDTEVAGLVVDALRQPPPPRAHGMLSAADVGRRVSLRAATHAPAGAPQSTDTVGRLRSWSHGRLVVERRDGSIAEITESDLRAGKVIPERPS